MRGFIPRLVICLLVLTGCNQHGKKLDFNNSEVYYTEAVTETQAKKLGEYLTGNGVLRDASMSLQLDKRGDVHLVRFVLAKGHKDLELTRSFRVLAREIAAQVFNGGKVEVHLCDDQFKTVNVVQIE